MSNSKQNIALNEQVLHYPFGMPMPGRSYTSENYRFGFQGQEKDDELKGQGNSVNFKYRMHDPRLGRFFAIDPLYKDYPWNSSYAFSENRVIDGIELEGLEYVPVQVKEFGYTMEQKVNNAVDVVGDVAEGAWGMIKGVGKGLGDIVVGSFQMGGGMQIIDPNNSPTMKESWNEMKNSLSETYSSGSLEEKTRTTVNLMALPLSFKKGGRGNNKLAPNKNAQGDHTSFMTGEKGNVYKYETYEKTKTGHFNPIKRYDGGKPDGRPGSPHRNKATGELIETPHVQGKGIDGGVRRPLQNEIPK